MLERVFYSRLIGKISNYEKFDFGTLYIGWSGSRNEKAQTRTQADNGHVQHSLQRSALCKTEGEVLRFQCFDFAIIYP